MYSHFDSNIWVTPFGLIFIFAILTAWAYTRRNATTSGIDASHIDLLMPIAVIVGIAGGTVVAMFMPMDHRVAGEMMNYGIRLRLFGMLAAGAVAVFIYSRFNKLSFRQLLDIFALPTMAALVIHRIGCFLAGCCWGDLVSHEAKTSLATQVQTLPFFNGLSGGVQYPPSMLKR